MLSGEGKALRTVKNSNRFNQQMSMRNFACAAHFLCTFLCRCFARLQRETSRNFLFTRFMEKMSYVFSLVHFFSLPLIFTLHLCRQHFSFCHRRDKIFVFLFQQKNVSFVFDLPLQISVALFLVELRWAAAYFFFFSVFLLLYIPNLWT